MARGRKKKVPETVTFEGKEFPVKVWPSEEPKEIIEDVLKSATFENDVIQVSPEKMEELEKKSIINKQMDDFIMKHMNRHRDAQDRLFKLLKVDEMIKSDYTSEALKKWTEKIKITRKLLGLKPNDGDIDEMMIEAYSQVHNKTDFDNDVKNLTGE